MDCGLTGGSMALATGYDFPDALSGGVAQGHIGGTLVLTWPEALDPAVADLISSRRPTSFRFVGGLNVLPLRPRNEAAWVLLSGF
jgi:hypothetical protein